MNHPHDDSDPIEHDPTGMRALLGSLPDPGPMPEGLVARISAALADEARAGTARSGDGWMAPPCPPELRADETAARDVAAAPAAGAAPVGAGAARATGPSGGRIPSGGEGDEQVVVPLHRRRALRILAAAAAVVGVLGAGGLIIETTRPGGLQAALGIVGSGGDDSSAGSGAGGSAADAPNAERAPADVVESDAGLHVEVLASGGSIASAELADYAAGLDTKAGSGAVPAPPAQEASPAPVTRPSGARDCATGLGVPPGDEVAVQALVVDGIPAAVVVATSSGGARTAWAVAPTCSASDPGVLSGPVPVP